MRNVRQERKRKKVIIGVLAGLLGFFIVFWAALLVFVLIGKEGRKPEETAETVSEPESEVREASETEEPSETETETVVLSTVPSTEETETVPRPTYREEEHRGEYRRIWIGDSRMVGFQRAVQGTSSLDHFIAKGAMYFEWFRDTAVPEMRQYLSDGEPWNVIIEMGVNDCANNTKGWTAFTVSDYSALINRLTNEYPKVRFYFMSVGRTVGNYRGTTIVKTYQVNPEINDFNARMQNDCYAIYLATGEYIYNNKLTYADGVHYSTATNQALYAYVLERLDLTVSEYFEPYPDELVPNGP